MTMTGQAFVMLVHLFVHILVPLNGGGVHLDHSGLQLLDLSFDSLRSEQLSFQTITGKRKVLAETTTIGQATSIPVSFVD